MPRSILRDARVTTIEEAAAWMLGHYDSEPRDAAAGAVFYLKLTGTVGSTWRVPLGSPIIYW